MAAAKKIKQIKETELTEVMMFSSDKKLMKEELQKRLYFEDPVATPIPGSNPPILNYRINIGIRNVDENGKLNGKGGDLVIGTDEVFSFGVSENKATDTGVLNGYSMSLSMYGRNGATEKQLRTVAFIECLADLLTEHILTEPVKDAINNWELEAAELKKLNPLYYKKEKGKIIPDASPSFYPKLIWFKPGKDKNGKEKPANMKTLFYSMDDVDENGEQVPVDPLEYLGVKCNVVAAIKIEGVYIGAKITLQCKLHEAEVKPVESGPKRLLKIGGQRNPTIMIGSNVFKDSSDSSVPAAAAAATSSPKVTTASSQPPEDVPELKVEDDEEEVKKPKPRKIKVKASEKTTN